MGAKGAKCDSRDGLLRGMFQLLGKTVLAGQYLTQIAYTRPIVAEESTMLEEEERYPATVFEQWMPFLGGLRPKPEVKVEHQDADTTGSTGPDDMAERHGASHDQVRTLDEPAASDGAQLHAAIASSLEQMQSDLSKLLTLCRESQPCTRGSNGENAMDHDGAREAAVTDSTSDAGGREGASNGPDAEGANADSPPSDHGHAFWSSLSLTALAEAQGVAPVEDLGSIAELWPADGNPDELLAHVLAERADRRRHARSRNEQALRRRTA